MNLAGVAPPDWVSQSTPRGLTNTLEWWNWSLHSFVTFLKSVVHMHSSKEIYNSLPNRSAEGTLGPSTFEMLHFISFLSETSRTLKIIELGKVNSYPSIGLVNFEKMFVDFSDISVFSEPDRLETIQSYRCSCVDGRSAHYTAVLKSEPTWSQILVFQNFSPHRISHPKISHPTEKLVSGFWFLRQSICLEILPLTCNF